MPMSQGPTIWEMQTRERELALAKDRNTLAAEHLLALGNIRDAVSSLDNAVTRLTRVLEQGIVVQRLAEAAEAMEGAGEIVRETNEASVRQQSAMLEQLRALAGRSREPS